MALEAIRVKVVVSWMSRVVIMSLYVDSSLLTFCRSSLLYLDNGFIYDARKASLHMNWQGGRL